VQTNIFWGKTRKKICSLLVAYQTNSQSRNIYEFHLIWPHLNNLAEATKEGISMKKTHKITLFYGASHQKSQRLVLFGFGLGQF